MYKWYRITKGLQRKCLQQLVKTWEQLQQEERDEEVIDEEEHCEHMYGRL